MPSSTSNDLYDPNTLNGSKAENQSTLERKYRDLQHEHQRLQDDLKSLQLQDFNTRNTLNNDEGKSHHVVSAQFVALFEKSTDWARDYFKIPFSAFRIEEHARFAEYLDGVLCGGCDWAGKEKMNVSYLVQAVVADVVSRRVLLEQFPGCPVSLRSGLDHVYDAMIKENPTKANQWRATAFAAYRKSELPSVRQAFRKTVAEEIETIVGPIARKHFPDRGDDEERFQESIDFIEAAENLAVVLREQAAALEIMDKSWFERSGRMFVCKDPRMKGRFSEGHDETEDGFQVDIILRPGFLKYGNDKGENLEKYAVWIPAFLDLSTKGSLVDPSVAIGAGPETTVDREMKNDNTPQTVIPIVSPGLSDLDTDGGESVYSEAPLQFDNGYTARVEPETPLLFAAADLTPPHPEQVELPPEDKQWPLRTGAPEIETKPIQTASLDETNKAGKPITTPPQAGDGDVHSQPVRQRKRDVFKRLWNRTVKNT